MSKTTSPAKQLYPDLDHELATTRRTLERFPAGKGEWRPHDKSMSLGQLASHLADLPQLGSFMFEIDEIDVLKHERTEPSNNAADLLARFDKSSARMNAAVSPATADDLGKKWTLRAGDQVIVSGPKSALLRTLLINHLVHHRAQLGVYYRLLGIPVPSMYGPSADEQA